MRTDTVIYPGTFDPITNGHVDLVERGELELQVGPVLPFERLRDAHRLMDQSNAGGKIVILVRDDET